MMSIGSVTLDEDLMWDNEYSYSPVRSSVAETLGGSIIVQEFVRSEAGRKIDLKGNDSSGWLSKTCVDALMELASVPGGTYLLTITNSGKTVTKSVRFRNEEDGGPSAFSPIVDKEGLYPDSFKYVGTIRLMVV